MPVAAPPRRLTFRLRGGAVRFARAVRLRLSVRHLDGPARFDLGPDDVVVIALVRDGAYYLDGFLRHYRSVGARHFVFFDNGSTDDTLARLAREPGVAVLSAALPQGAADSTLRAFAATRYARVHWVLLADMDGMIDPPCGDLTQLVRHMRVTGHTAQVARMLEMFPDGPLRAAAGLPYDAVPERFVHYDLTHIDRHPNHRRAIEFAGVLTDNTLADSPPDILFGGVRARVFGESCCLTKHLLVFVGPGVRVCSHPHASSKVACAGFTGLIRHYRFAKGPFGRDARTTAAASISHGEDRRRLAVARRDPDVTLWPPDAARFASAALLRAAGFLSAADTLPEGLRDG